MPEPSEPDTYMKDDASEAYAAYPTRTCEWEIDGEVPSGDLRLSRERQRVSFRHTEVGNQCGVAWTQVHNVFGYSMCIPILPCRSKPYCMIIENYGIKFGC